MVERSSVAGRQRDQGLGFSHGERKKTIEGFGKEVTSINFIGITDQALATSGDSKVRLVQRTGPRSVLSPRERFRFSAAATPNGKIVIAGARIAFSGSGTEPTARSRHSSRRNPAARTLRRGSRIDFSPAVEPGLNPKYPRRPVEVDNRNCIRSSCRERLTSNTNDATLLKARARD